MSATGGRTQRNKEKLLAKVGAMASTQPNQDAPKDAPKIEKLTNLQKLRSKLHGVVKTQLKGNEPRKL